MSKLALPKGKKVKRPLRQADYVSKRGVDYWWAPEWVRDQNGTIGRIVPLKHKDGVNLHMLSKDGKSTYIQGSIQQEFHEWHANEEIDAILLGLSEDEIIATNWEYV